MFDRIKYYLDKYKLVVICIISLILTLFIGWFYLNNTIEKKEFTETYSVDYYTAIDNFNKKTVDFLNNNYSNTNVIISPLTMEKSYYTYMKQNDIINDKLFLVFGNGLFDFDTSSCLLDENLINVFTVGKSKNSFTKADIEVDISDRFALDEINAKINTLSDNKIVYKVKDTTVFNYNIFGLCVLDTDIIFDKCIEDEKNYLVSGTFETYKDNDIFFIKIPLENEDYSLIIKKGTDLSYDKFISLYTENNYCYLRLPKINYESVDNPSKLLVNTSFADSMTLDSNLMNLTTICHLNIHYKGLYDATINDFDDKDILDLSSDCSFYIQNNNTGNYVIVGNIM